MASATRRVYRGVSAAGRGGVGAPDRDAISSPECTENTYATIVDQEAQIAPALTDLRERDAMCPFLVNCEGQDLSRRGELSVVCVATKNCGYLFDIKTLGAGVFDQGLRDLLEVPEREKVMFDCRQDADCLWHQFQVKLANVLDLQLLEIIYREDRRPNRPESKRLVRGYLSCLQKYASRGQAKLIQVKQACKPMMADSGRIWLERPIQATLREYAALSLRGYLPLYVTLSRGLGRDGLARLRSASQRYLDSLRAKEVRLYDKFERNAYLPWRVIPEQDQTDEYLEETMCVGCKRKFPRSDFVPFQLRMGRQKCQVCLNVSYEKKD